MQQIYVAPFETAIKEGGAGAVMCSYNKIHGVYACENPSLLTTILKGQFGFDGWVMSDWFATHSTADSANAGLDEEMPVLGEVNASASGVPAGANRACKQKM
jgi:beta-glucosidase